MLPGLHPLHPTIRPLTGSNLGSQPSAGAPSGAPEGEAQGIAKQLAAFSGGGGRPIGRANANALAAEGDAGEGWWPNQWARAVIWVAVSKPWSSSGVGWGASVPLGQRISRRRSDLNHHPAPPPDCFQGQASHSPAADVPINRTTNTRGALLATKHYRQARFTTARTTSASWPFNRG